MLNTILHLLGLRHDYAFFGLIRKDWVDHPFSVQAYSVKTFKSANDFAYQQADEIVKKYKAGAYTFTDIKRF